MDQRGFTISPNVTDARTNWDWLDSLARAMSTVPLQDPDAPVLLPQGYDPAIRKRDLWAAPSPLGIQAGMLDIHPDPKISATFRQRFDPILKRR